MAQPNKDPLEDVLKHGETLPSWKAVFARLTASPAVVHTELLFTVLSEYLLSPTYLKALSRPHAPFIPPSATSKQDFESRTAAIHFDSAEQPGSLPSLKNLKEDALQLSVSLKIEELTALRIVILEYQARETVALLRASTSHTADQAGGLFRSDNATKNSGQNETPEEKKEKVLQRRIAIYLQERRYVIKCATYLVRASFAKRNTWKPVGRRLVSELKTGENDALKEIIKAIRSRVVENDAGAPQLIEDKILEGSAEGREALFQWDKQVLLETIHLLQLLFILCYRPMEVTGTVAASWFKLMDDTAFFQQDKPPPSQQIPDIENLRSYLQPLCSILSLTILCLDKVDEFMLTSITKEISVPPTGGVVLLDNDFFLKSSNALIEITHVLTMHARNPVASLAVFGWSLILRRIGEFLLVFNINIQDLDSPTPTPSQFATPTKRRRTGHFVADLYVSTMSEIFSRSPQGKTTAAYLAKTAIDCCNIFQVIVNLVALGAIEGKGGITWSITIEEDGKKMKAVLATLVRKSTEIVKFSQGILSSALILNEVAVDEAWEISHSTQEILSLDEEEGASPANSMSEIVDNWWSDTEALHNVLIPARARFPYEPMPFLKVTRSLGTDVLHTLKLLSTMETYTQVLPVGFTGYEILESRAGIENGNGSATGSVDESDTPLIELVEELTLFAPRLGTGYQTGGDIGGGGITLSPGTRGRVISDTRAAPPVVMWDHRYSALTFFGRVLECALVGSAGGGSKQALSRRGAAIADELGNKEAVGEIIGIYTAMILASSLTLNGTPVHRAELIEGLVRESSHALAQNRDFIGMILDLLEDELMRSSGGSTTEYSTEFITIGLHFVDALMPVLPNRVWPYLARSSLLQRGNIEGTLMRVTNQVEVVKGEYIFTCTALRLFEDLVEDGIKGAVAKSGLPGNSALVSTKRAGPGAGVSATVQKEILESWTHWGVDLFESYRGWKYTNGAERMEIGRRVANILRRILEVVYGVDDSPDSHNKVIGILASSAEHIVKVFLSDSSNALPLQPIIGAIQDGVATPESSLFTKPLEGWFAQVAGTMKFAATLVRVRAYLGLPPSQLENELYKISSSIAKIYAVHERFRLPAVDLLEAIVVVSGSNQASPEPPSLLGHLGTECANAFTQMLVGLDSPTHDLQLETAIFNFIAAVVSNKQQGLSILLLRGETLMGRFGGKDNTTIPADGKKPRSILTVALDALSKPELINIQPEHALSMLEAVALSQNYWSLAIEDLGQHPKFIPGLIKYIETFTEEFQPQDSKEVLTTKANKVAAVAYIAQIIAMFIHTKRASSSRHEPGFISQLLDPKTLKYYFNHGVRITNYRRSLHGQLEKNFGIKWPGLGLMKLKKTKLKKKVYGPGYLYDLELAGQLLGFDKFWEVNGARRTRTNSNGDSKGYKEEVELANINLSLIDSQVVLMRAWRLLALELCPLALQNADLSKSLIGVVESCLTANTEVGQLPPAITKVIHTERAEFAFIIMRKLSQRPIKLDTGPLYQGVLKNVWKAILYEKTDFRKALSTGEGIAYFRSLLRIAYMALVAQQSRTEAVPVAICYIILDMLDLIVAQGFKDLAQAAQSNPETTNPEDIALITGILQTSLRLKGIEVIHSGLGMHIGEQCTIRAATTLYSWAEQIGVSQNGYDDPVYGELAVLFLLELSYVPLLAEQLAVERILGLLITSSLSHTISNLMTSGLNNPVHFPRLHNIWARGLLPILVNLLSAIGPRIGPDVVQFLSFFGRQIEGLVESWHQQGNAITLPGVRETSTLVGILEILRSWGVSIPSPKTKALGNGEDIEMGNSIGPTGGISGHLHSVFGESNAITVDGIRFDKGTVLEGVEYLLNHKNYLASLVVPTTLEEEEENSAVEELKEKGDVSKLVEKVIKEMDVLRKLLTVVIGEAEKR